MPAIDLDLRVRYQRWIASIGLAAAAEDSARVDTPETRAMALLAAHAACEVALGLIAGVVREPAPGKDIAFRDLMAEARKRTKLDATLLDDLSAMHRVRNGFVHSSTTVDPSEVARATSSARRLLDVAASKVLGSRRGAGGVATAVADVITIEPIGIWLRHADVMLRAGKVTLAANALARALGETLSRTVPRLHTDRRLSREASSAELRRISSGLGMGGKDREIASRIESLDSWVLPLALGISPAAYSQLRSTIGATLPVDIGGAPYPVDRRDAPAPDDVRRAASLVAAVAFRLWSMGSLEPSDVDDRLVELAQPLLEKERAG